MGPVHRGPPGRFSLHRGCRCPDAAAPSLCLEAGEPPAKPAPAGHPRDRQPRQGDRQLPDRVPGRSDQPADLRGGRRRSGDSECAGRDAQPLGREPGRPVQLGGRARVERQSRLGVSQPQLHRRHGQQRGQLRVVDGHGPQCAPDDSARPGMGRQGHQQRPPLNWRSAAGWASSRCRVGRDRRVRPPRQPGGDERGVAPDQAWAAERPGRPQRAGRLPGRVDPPPRRQVRRRAKRPDLFRHRQRTRPLVDHRHRCPPDRDGLRSDGRDVRAICVGGQSPGPERPAART